MLRASNLPRRLSRRLSRQVEEVLSLEETIATLSDAEIESSFQDLAEAPDVIQAFALAREAAFRHLGQKAYPEQILGGLCVAAGCIVEMRTGEGKTLTLTLPAAFLALSGPVHVATANDYLARRDASLMEGVYARLGLTTGLSAPEMDLNQKKQAYAADVMYSTAQQLGFDYLTDHLYFDAGLQVQSRHFAAVVDEADSLLVDEARTPLVIAGPSPEDAEDLSPYARIASALSEDEHVLLDRGNMHLALTPLGIETVEAALGVENLYEHALLAHRVTTALQAAFLFERDKDYLVGEGDTSEVKIIDEFTGRVLEGRRFQNGIHEALEAKEGLPPQAPQITQASISIQSYFGLYEHLAGMTGTAATDAAEIYRTYSTPVAVVPTHRPVAREDLPDLLFATRTEKIAALAERVAEAHDAGRPVLLGTPSVQESEAVSLALSEAGIPHQVLSAKNPASEAEVVARAGRRGTVTVATNMAGRGVDIKLGGDPSTPDFDPAEREEVLSLGGLLVLGAARHSSRRVDNQLRGRSGRQGEPGETQFYLSLEDDLLSYFAAERVTSLLSSLTPTGEPLPSRLLSVADRAQRFVEQNEADGRAAVLKFDRTYAAQRESYYLWRDQVLAAPTLRSFLRPWLEKVYSSPELSPHSTHAPFEHAHPISPTDLADLGMEALEEKFASLEDLTLPTLRPLFLQRTDSAWAHLLTHLRSLEDASQLQAHAQVVPYVAFSQDASAAFAEAMERAMAEIVGLIWTAQIELTPVESPEGTPEDTLHTPEEGDGVELPQEELLQPRP